MQTSVCAKVQAFQARTSARRAARRAVVQPVRATAAPAQEVDELGFKLMRKGIKEASPDTILTPR